jgi:glycosyltransferase involved in cell wall biosynthesis
MRFRPAGGAGAADRLMRRMRAEPERTTARSLALRALLSAACIPWTAGCGAGATAAPPGSTTGAAGPERPRARVDITYPSSLGATLLVPSGGNLQAALSAALPGDVVVLEAGGLFTGPFTLPRKDGASWIVVRSSALDRLPPAGTRVQPSQAALMPALEAGAGAVITADPGAHHYRFVGIEVRPARGAFLLNLVRLGQSETSLDALPHHLVFDRCYLHGDPKKGSRRGIALGSRETAIVDSWLSDFKEVGADSQAIAGWNGPGPFRIENDYLEGAGENVLFGGADPSVPDLVPADIEVLRNHFTKPLAWKVDEPAYEGTAWTVKNLFELKNARRVLVSGNLFEHSWVQAQTGFAILLTVRNQDGQSPWSVVEDVTFRSNVVRHTAAGVDILGRDDNAPSGRTARVTLRNNVFEDVGTERWGGGGKLFQVLSGAADVVIEHNTAFQTGSIVTAEGEPEMGFVYRDNIAPHNAFGIVGTGVASGANTLGLFFPGSVFRRNVIAGGDATRYPPDNFFPASLDGVGFVDRAAGDYRLSASSPYHRAATDGTDVGADFDELAQSLGTSSIGPAAALVVPAPGVERVGAGLVAEEAVFWSCLFALAYAHVGYPLLIHLWAWRRPRPFRTGTDEPSVTLVVAAHNEAGEIDGRLENLLSLDYPRDRLEIVVGSDGSDDGTAERARAHERVGLRVVEFASRRGKPSVLNALVEAARGEIVVLADARQRFDHGALRALVAPFADPEVGAVTGELTQAEGSGAAVATGMGLYWRWERSIRRSEGRASSVVGATGAIYALRRELFEPLPADTILDDVLVPMRIVRRGHRVVFESRARAYDRAAGSAAGEFSRKVRTISGNFQLFTRERWLLGFRNPLWFQTVSHKGLRLLTPALLLLALAANLLLVDVAWWFRVLLAAQAAFYAAALAGLARGGSRSPAVIAVPYVVCLLAGATVVAFFRYAFGPTPLWPRVAAGRP